ncbi:MAG: hypothetical protein N3E45_17085 [Oscillatoriaceae bacterium SKW80]|nr:hypothetical protein [Oscillatoriaceae bacterium SKW80]HIK27974.1 hypothetical protein [Oscillatoriaceae cyanobacterium M7585_C2015_266]
MKNPKFQDGQLINTPRGVQRVISSRYLKVRITTAYYVFPDGHIEPKPYILGGRFFYLLDDGLEYPELDCWY